MLAQLLITELDHIYDSTFQPMRVNTCFLIDPLKIPLREPEIG